MHGSLFMATKFDKEMLKKHHFWVLLAPVILAAPRGLVRADF